MNIFITCPSLAVPHGGLRVILELANHLTKWHKVYLHVLNKDRRCKWFAISPAVRLVNANMRGMDCLLITSPHSIDFQDRPHRPAKVFLHMQMLENYFQPDNKHWFEMCKRFYTSSHPLMSISQWNMRELKETYGRTGVTHYIGNGVNLQHFPIVYKLKDFKTILVEGWEGYNPAKDTEHIGPKVAARLKAEGYYIIAYGQKRLQTMKEVPDEYHLMPSLAKMNELYERATILMKASKWDARACGPIESMTKGTPTARAIIEGDDDLIDGINCLKVGYDEDKLYWAAKTLLVPVFQNTLSMSCLKYAQENTWDKHIAIIKGIICAD